MPRLIYDEMALIVQALRGYSALIGQDAQRMAPTMASPVRHRGESAVAVTERDRDGQERLDAVGEVNYVRAGRTGTLIMPAASRPGLIPTGLAGASRIPSDLFHSQC